MLWPKDVLRTKNSVIAVFPYVSEKAYIINSNTYNININNNYIVILML